MSTYQCCDACTGGLICEKFIMPSQPAPNTDWMEVYDQMLHTAVAHETQESVSAWAVSTFGDAGTNVSCATRMNKEAAELLMCLANQDDDPKAGEECADVLICLYRVAERLGVDLHAEVDRKMAVNRKREWKLDGHGHGYHA